MENSNLHFFEYDTLGKEIEDNIGWAIFAPMSRNQTISNIVGHRVSYAGISRDCTRVFINTGEIAASGKYIHAEVINPIMVYAILNLCTQNLAPQELDAARREDAENMRRARLGIY